MSRGLHEYSPHCTLTHSVKGSDYASHPNESLARESIYLWPVKGYKAGVRAKIYMASHKSNTVGEHCCCQLLVLNVCVSYFWCFCEFSSVQSSPVILFQAACSSNLARWLKSLLDKQVSIPVYSRYIPPGAAATKAVANVGITTSDILKAADRNSVH